MSLDNKKILIMAGGTGGHVYPALAVAYALKEAGAHVEWLGGYDSFEEKKLKEHDFHINLIHVKPLRGRSFFGRFSSLFYLVRGFFESIFLFQSYIPDLIIGMGGYVSAPGGIAARILGIPLLIHEQNAYMGLTNRKLAKYAERVMLAFPVENLGDIADKSVLTGNPVRADIAAIAPPDKRYAEREGPLRVLVLGGSQGAQALNRLVPQTMAKMSVDERPMIVHQSGPRAFAETEEYYRQLGVKADVRAFIDDIDKVYAEVDYVIARAGASTVAEIATVGLAAILIPYPYAVDDHQMANARALLERALITREEGLDADQLLEYVRLFHSRTDLQQLAQLSREKSHANALTLIMQTIHEVIE